MLRMMYLCHLSQATYLIDERRLDENESEA